MKAYHTLTRLPIQEISENAADASHFNIVHEKSAMAGSEPGGWGEFFNFADDVYSASWTPMDEKKHVASVEIKHQMLLFKKILIPGSNSKVFQV
jgi:hypothetical protein